VTGAPDWLGGVGRELDTSVIALPPNTIAAPPNPDDRVARIGIVTFVVKTLLHSANWRSLGRSSGSPNKSRPGTGSQRSPRITATGSAGAVTNATRDRHEHRQHHHAGGGPRGGPGALLAWLGTVAAVSQNSVSAATPL